MGKRRRMDWKGRVCRKLNPDGIAIRMIQNEGFRLGICAVCGFAFNIIFAVFNGIVGWLGSSPWFGTLSAYYILLSAMRCYWLVKRSAHAGAKQQKRRKIRKSLCRRYGIFFLLYGSSSGWCGHPPDPFGGREGVSGYCHLCSGVLYFLQDYFCGDQCVPCKEKEGTVFDDYP